MPDRTNSDYLGPLDSVASIVPPEAVQAGAGAIDLHAGSSAVIAEAVIKAALPWLRFSPLGDNHHNAALCPYCSPERVR